MSHRPVPLGVVFVRTSVGVGKVMTLVNFRVRWYLQDMKTTGIEIDIGVMNGVMSVCSLLSILHIVQIVVLILVSKQQTFSCF